MPWFKVEDEFDNKADTRAREDAIGLFFCMGTWSSRNLTDGVVLKAVARSLPAYTPKRIKLLLLDRGGKDGKPWIVEQGENYIIRSFLNFNPSADEVIAKREAEAKRKADWRGTKKETKPRTDAECPSGTDSGHPPGVTSLPVPVPIRTEREIQQGVTTDSARKPDSSPPSPGADPSRVLPPGAGIASHFEPDDDDPNAKLNLILAQAGRVR